MELTLAEAIVSQFISILLRDLLTEKVLVCTRNDGISWQCFFCCLPAKVSCTTLGRQFREQLEPFTDGIAGLLILCQL